MDLQPGQAEVSKALQLRDRVGTEWVDAPEADELVAEAPDSSILSLGTPTLGTDVAKLDQRSS
ncbi:MAG: hypothetical protein ABI352_10055 [Candidatus Dormibacter sp.]